jgi:hypothetical protein
MKFRFIGDPNHNGSGPDILEKFDHVFTRSDWTDVEDKEAIRKLLGHSHFESFCDSTFPAKLAISDEREALIRDAEELGIVVDRRWSNLTLSSKIKEALAP